uniref:Uncharacterized protein n=1 Tax=Anolis carolinensis TaxID=28377 RepID=A0A803SKQ6_ANOCA
MRRKPLLEQGTIFIPPISIKDPPPLLTPPSPPPPPSLACSKYRPPAWAATWAFISFRRLKMTPHSVQGVVLRLKVLPQSAQAKGRSPVWMRWWVIRVPLRLKLLPHSRQVKGFSPVWMRRCLISSPLWLKRLPQSAQAKGRSPVWIRWWRVCLEQKLFPQTEHSKGFSPVWMRKWVIRLPRCWKRLPHTLQAKGRSAAV